MTKNACDERTIEDVISGKHRWAVIHGDCLDVMRTMPGCCVDAVVTDAPYGLGKEPDPVALLTAWLSDVDAKTNARGFMNRSWDVVPGPAYWRECYRVMKPGAYLLTFAGTRTEDLMGIALRLAGFQRVDTIAWIQAQGMAKSVNIERRIAMHQCTLPGRHFSSTLPKGSKRRSGDHLCPETEESVKWRGQGSGLKPTHEPVLVCRKPIDGTYARSVLTWGTAMNIDAARVAHASPEDFEQHNAGVDAIRARGGEMADSWKNSSDLSGASEVTKGRWPPNTVFSHSPGCKRIGAVEVAANPTWDTPNRATEPSAFTGAKVSKVRHTNGRDGEASAERRYSTNGSTSFAAKPGARRDDTETVEQWECADGCPVAELARQSGVRKSGAMKAGTPRPRTSACCYGEMSGAETSTDIHASSGSAARFFHQFSADDGLDCIPWKYQSKPSRREKDKGLQRFRPRSGAEATHSNEDDARLNCGRTGAGHSGGARNIHPTSKPIELAKWVTRLVARPGQLVLNPFAGAGSEGLAAVAEGCRWIGIELNDTDEEPFVSIARARLTDAEGGQYVPRDSLAAPDAKADEKPEAGENLSLFG